MFRRGPMAFTGMASNIGTRSANAARYTRFEDPARETRHTHSFFRDSIHPENIC